MTVRAEVASLFEPLAVRRLQLANRFVMSPMTRGFSPDGVPDESVAAYYRRRAEGGVGLIITEGVGVDHPAALGETNVPHLHADAALAGWRRVVNEVHAAGARIAPQLWHQGVMRRGGGPHPEAESMRPSGLWGPTDRTTSMAPDYLEWAKQPTRPMTEEEIADVIAAYGRSACNAHGLGFDAIAIHGAHGYLPDTFLWEETNRRTDRWGGSRIARTRAAAELIRAVRAAIGEGPPIIFRFSQFKMQDFNARLAHTPDELQEVLGPLADAGVDVFDASTRYFNRAEFEGSPLGLAGWAKKVTGKATMTVGGVGLGGPSYSSDGKRTGTSMAANNLDLVIARFARGEFDLVAVGRSLLHDPKWTQKARAGEPFEGYDVASRSMLW